MSPESTALDDADDSLYAVHRTGKSVKKQHPDTHTHTRYPTHSPPIMLTSTYVVADYTSLSIDSTPINQYSLCKQKNGCVCFEVCYS